MGGAETRKLTMVKLPQCASFVRGTCHASIAAPSVLIRSALQTVLFNCKDVVFDEAAFSAFLLDHLAYRLDRVEPGVLL